MTNLTTSHPRACAKCQSLILKLARSHAVWRPDLCARCRVAARRYAYKKRRRDPIAVQFTRALLQRFGFAPFSMGEAIAVGTCHGRTPGFVAELLSQFIEDGVLTESVAPSALGSPTFMFDTGERAGRLSTQATQPKGATLDNSERPAAPKAPRRKAAPHHRVSCSLQLLAPTADSNVRCVAAPHIDGGSGFGIRATVDRWHPDLLRVVERLAAQRMRRRGPSEWVTLTGPDGKAFGFEVHARRSYCAFVAEGRAQLNVFRHDGRIVLEMKAAEPEAEGFEEWARTWFDLATFLATGRRCTGARDAAAQGWFTRNLELAADFTGLLLYPSDPQNFVNVRNGGSRPGCRRVDSHGFRDGTIETLDIGRRGRNVLAISTHDKTQKLLTIDKLEPSVSVYATTWRSNGWRNDECVRRVEVRAHGRALHVASRIGEALDLRDPAALLDMNALSRFWRHATTRRTRLVTPGPARLRRAQTDPRWVAVQNAGQAPLGEHFVCVPRDARRALSLAASTRRADMALDRAAARAAVLKPDDPDLFTFWQARIRRRPEAQAQFARAKLTLGWRVEGTPHLLGST